jgi:glycosyltransferase family protein
MKKFILKVYYVLLDFKEHCTVFYNKIISLIIKPPLVKSTDETLDKMINEKCSVSRYGDGEFNIIFKGSIFFQAPNNDLRQRLIEILISQSKNHIVCIPDVISNQSRFTEQAKRHWVKYLALNRSKIYRSLDMKKEYYDAMVTRLYMDYKDKRGAGERFIKFRMIWEDREVVMVEGEQSRLGIGNDLLNNAKSIKRILCPAVNAFEKYDEILAAVKKHDQSKLILIALGPTATVLAYDLSELGYQALDIGNVDIEYEWFLKRAVEKFPVKNKYIGEVPDGTKVGDIQDQRYESEIYYQII